MEPKKHVCKKCGREFESREEQKEAKCPACGASQTGTAQQQAGGCATPASTRFK